MPEKISNRNKKELIDKIIRVAYGDAGLIDRIIVLWNAAVDKNVKQLLVDYRTTADKVHKLKQAELPDYIIEKVNEKISIQTKPENEFLKLSHVFFMILSRKAIPVVTSGIIILAVVSFLIFREPATNQKYTKAEIELAEKQFKQSLAIVGRVFKSTESKLDKDILKTKVSKQLKKGLIIVSDYVTGG